MTRWRREGLLLGVKPGHAWWTSHAQSPTVLPISERLWRLYFAARDADNRAHIVAVDLDPADRMRILAEHLAPMLPPGPPGAFDEAGMGPSAVLRHGSTIRLYYTGTTVRRDVRFQQAIGLAVSEDGLAFRKATPGPLLSTGPFDPLFSSSPGLLAMPDGFRMWYTAGTEWRADEDGCEPVYDIRVARSADGVAWDPRTELAVPCGDGELGLARPCVLADRHGVRLWFSRRGARFRGNGAGAYRLAATEMQPDGSFAAAEPVMFENPPAPGDCDDAMQAYACLVRYRDDLVMFYNGNGFGAAGICWATLRGAG